MQIQFISSFAVITQDPPRAAGCTSTRSGCRCRPPTATTTSTAKTSAAAKHFGVWPLAQAAQACFGTPEWPSDRPVPQASVEFEVEDAAAVEAAAKEMEERGYPLLHHARQEPWGQTVARLISPENVVVGISYAPWQH